MKLKTRLIVAGLTLWILGIAVLLNDGAGAFFGQMSNGTCDYYTMTHADVCENLPVNGTCYVVYDYIAASVTEETDKYTGKQTSTDNAYYYVIPLDDVYMMLVKTKPNTQLTYDFDQLVEDFWAEDESAVTSLSETGTKLDGILVKNNPGVVDYYNEWRDTLELSQEEFKLSEYTLDCTIPLSTRIKEFWGGSILLIAFIVTLVVFLMSIFRKKRTPAYTAPMPNSYGMGGYPSGGAQPNGAYDPTAAYGSVNTNLPQSNIPSQSGLSIGKSLDSDINRSTSYNGFQTQGGQNAGSGYSSSNYGTNQSTSYNGFQTQGGQNTDSGYSSSNYGTNQSTSYNGFQTQGGQNTDSGYSSSNYGTNQNSSYNGFQTQGGQNAGNGYDSNNGY